MMRRRLRLRLTLRGLAMAIAAVLFAFGAYWSRQVVFLVPALLAAAALAAGVVLAISSRPTRSVSWKVPDVGVEDTLISIPFALDARFSGGRWRAWQSFDALPTFWEPLGPDATGVLDVDSLPRGVHSVGPIAATMLDPFGMTRATRVVGEAEPLIIGPRITQLDSATVLGHGIDAQADAAGRGDLVDQLVRDYRAGDPMRRIHWRQSAHQGRLMVRQDHPPSTPRATVVLDTLQSGYTSLDEFDEAVRAFASIMQSLARQGVQVAVVETGARQLGDSAELGDRTRLLIACARLEPHTTVSTDDVVGPAIVVCGDASPRQHALNHRLAVGSVVWNVVNTPLDVPRGVRQIAWQGGSPHEIVRALA